MRVNRGVVIRLELDPELVGDQRDAYDRAARPLRLVPVVGGVRLMRAGKLGPVHATPASLQSELADLGFSAWERWQDFRGSRTATWWYWHDCVRFLLAAMEAVRRDRRILALWGLEP